MPPKIILHIDDDDDDCKLLKEAIEANDVYLVKQYSNGREGLKFLEQAKAFGDIPCLIILDMNMPVMDGREVVKKLKQDEILSKVSVVVLTTSDGFADKEFCKKYAVPLHVKPFTLKDFDAVINKILEYA